MASFGTSPNLQLLSSPDGISWTLLDSFMVDGSSGYLRDPSIMYYDGSYWIAYTNCQNSTSVETNFGIRSATNLGTWSSEIAVSPGVSGTVRVWAPEFFQDPVSGNVYVYVAISTSGGLTTSPFSIYVAQALNTSLTSWSSFSQVYSGNYSIDPYVVYAGGAYYLWYKNNNTGYVEYATSSSPTGIFTAVETGNWAGWGNSPTYEGPCVLNTGGDNWIIYFDNNTDSVGQSYSVSTNNWSTWSAPTPIASPYVANHGTTIVNP
jgi:hypothetical protein